MMSDNAAAMEIEKLRADRDAWRKIAGEEGAARDELRANLAAVAQERGNEKEFSQWLLKHIEATGGVNLDLKVALQSERSRAWLAGRDACVNLGWQSKSHRDRMAALTPPAEFAPSEGSLNKAAGLLNPAEAAPVDNYWVAKKDSDHG